VAHAWMPGARRIRAGTDGGPLRGGAPRAVWLTLGTAPGSVSIQSAAARLAAEDRPCHLIWDPTTGEIAQLISILRAGRALGAAEHLTTARMPAARVAPSSIRGAEAADVNTEGRVCVQIGVLGHPGDPFTRRPLAGVTAIVNWLDSWSIPRRWPAGRPAEHHHDAGHPADVASTDASRALWALGGHFGASQVPGCASHGPGGIDTDLLTGAHIRHVHQREQRHSLSSAALPIPALEHSPEMAAVPEDGPPVQRHLIKVDLCRRKRERERFLPLPLLTIGAAIRGPDLWPDRQPRTGRYPGTLQVQVG
jgi:hypothetical protein